MSAFNRITLNGVEVMIAFNAQVCITFFKIVGVIIEFLEVVPNLFFQWCRCYLL